MIFLTLGSSCVTPPVPLLSFFLAAIAHSLPRWTPPVFPFPRARKTRVGSLKVLVRAQGRPQKRAAQLFTTFKGGKPSGVRVPLCTANPFLLPELFQVNLYSTFLHTFSSLVMLFLISL